MKALVTGAGGFVGSHLAQRLARDGAAVRALVRAAPRDARLSSPGIELVSGDLRDEASLEAALRGCDVVYHLAAARGHAAWDECREVNVKGTGRLAEAAARAGVGTFVLASTRGVHGLVRGRIDERTPTAPNTPYRASKLLGEELVTRVSDREGLRATILRLPSMMGAGAIGWLGLFRAIAKGGFRIVGSGRNRQHPCHVADAVDGIVRAGVANGIGCETYVLGGSQSSSLEELVRRIAGELGVGVARVHVPAAPYRALSAMRTWLARRGNGLPASSAHEVFLASYEIDDAKARRELGYDPKRSIAEGVRDTLDSYRADSLL